MKITSEQIRELKTLLWILDSKHNASASQTQENINYIADEIVKIFYPTVGVKQFPFLQKVEWDWSEYWVIEDNGGYEVLVANTPETTHSEYNDWWVNREELNAI